MASLVTRIAALIATLTAITTLAVPLNDTYGKTNPGLRGEGAGEAPIAFNYDGPQEFKHSSALETAAKATAPASRGLDDLGLQFKGDNDNTGVSKITAFKNQSTRSFGSQDDDYIGSRNDMASINNQDGILFTHAQHGKDFQSLSNTKHCDCNEITFLSSLAQFSAPYYPFKPTKTGELPQTFSFSQKDPTINACSLTDWSSFCGPPQFEFTDIESRLKITTFPHKGLAWHALTYQLDLHPQRDDPAGLHKVQLNIYHPSRRDVRQSVEIEYLVSPASELNNQRNLATPTPGYCLNLPNLLNLLDSEAYAEQTSFFLCAAPFCTSICQTATCGCDGEMKDIPNFYEPNIVCQSDTATTSDPQSWKVTFKYPASIKTTLFTTLNGQGEFQSYLTVTVGNNTDVTTNPTCVAQGTMTHLGWYQCSTPMTGTTFGFYTTSGYLKFLEVSAYSQEAIQMNPGVTVSFIGNNTAGYPVSNALQNIVVLLSTDISLQKCVQIDKNNGPPTFSIKFKAQVPINGVVVLPSLAQLQSQPSYQNQTNVAIYSKTVGGTQQLCGVLADYYNKYSEAACNIEANEIIAVQQNPNTADKLIFCGFGVLADCSCNQSSFDPLKFTTNSEIPFASATSISVKSTDSVQKIILNTQIPDTISSTCGSADGISNCGPRVISFKDKSTGMKILNWPYQGFEWNKLTSVLTLDPAQAATTCVLTATISLLNYPLASFSQDITRTVELPLKIPIQTLNAIINEQATLQLPSIIGVQYIVTSLPAYKALVEGSKLTVISLSIKDIGTQSLQMSASTATQTLNFTVNVIFEASKAIVEDNSTTASITGAVSTNSKSESVIQTPSSASPKNTTTTSKATVLAASETDSLLDKVKCVEDDSGNISCQFGGGPTFFMDPATGKFMTSPPSKTPQTKTSASPTQPKLVISKVDTEGKFFFKFSDPMELEALILPTKFTRQLKSSKAKSKTSSATIASSEPTQPQFILSEQHLRLSIRSENTTQPHFSWHAIKITTTEILVQLVFEDPLYISNNPGSLDKLVITILPPALKYFKTLATGALTDDPLRTVIKDLPPQVILGKAIESAKVASDSLKNFGQSSVAGNVVVQILLSGSMAQMWSMVNSIQITLSYQLLSLHMPGNVIMIMTNLQSLADFNVFPTDAILSFLFQFTPTVSPGVGFATIGTDNASLTLFLGPAFLIMILIGLQYLLYGLVYGCRKYDSLINKIEQKLRPGLILGAFYLFLIETYLDWAIGSALRLEQPKFVTPSDYFDFGLACAGIVITIVFPVYCLVFLKRNVNQLDNEEFKQKHGALFQGFSTYNARKRRSSINMTCWFLLRRFLTAVNLVFLRNQTIWIQLTLNMWLSLFDLCVKLDLSPFESKLGGFMDKLNDLFVLTCAYFPYLFTDLTPSQEDKYYIGWFYSGIIGILITANLFVMVVAACQDLKKKIGRMIYKCKHEKETKAMNQRRENTKAAMLKAQADGVFLVAAKMRKFPNELHQDQQARLEQFKLYKQFERKKARDEAKARVRAEEQAKLHSDTRIQLLNISEVIEEESSASQLVSVESSEQLSYPSTPKMMEEANERSVQQRRMNAENEERQQLEIDFQKACRENEIALKKIPKKQRDDVLLQQILEDLDKRWPVAHKK